MSGAMRRIGEYLGLLEDTGRYDEYDGQYDDGFTGGREPQSANAAGYGHGQETARLQQDPPARRRPESRPAPVADLTERRRSAAASSDDVGGAGAPVGVVAELSRIITLHPSTYNEARNIGENFREGTPVIMNLSEMDDTDAKRLVDFAAGLVFATRGTIERITNKVFLLSPPNVSVAAEDKQRIVAGGFFNQS
ncbi:MAG: cell division protein SepF [Nocardioides sp.]